MSGIIVGILIVCVGVYFYKKFNKKSPCCKSKQNDSTTVNTDKVEVFEELKNTVESTSELETISENKREEIEREIKEINIKKLDVTTENLPDIIEMYRPNEVTMETITEAVENNEKNSSLGREPILFDDLISLTEQVNKLNALEKAKAEAIAEDMLNQAKLLSDLNDIHLTECDKYYTELGTPITK